MKSAVRVAALVWICATGTVPSAQQTQSTDRQHREPVKIVRLYGDASGETHLETIALTLDTPGARSDVLRGPGNVRFARFASDMNANWHTSARRQYLVTLSGAGYEIEVTDGTKVRFPQGSVLLADDMKSKGHRTRGLGTESLIMYVETDDLPSK